jgi:hypothetical protein
VGTAAAKHREFAIDLTSLAPWPHFRFPVQGKDYVRVLVLRQMAACILMHA